jgi:hypothetical protein
LLVLFVPLHNHFLFLFLLHFPASLCLAQLVFDQNWDCSLPCTTSNQKRRAQQKDISHAQYLDLIYSQSSMLYDLILQDPHPSTNLNTVPPTEYHVIHGVVGYVTQDSASKTSSQSNPKVTPTTTTQNTSPPTTTLAKISKISMV